MEGEAEEDQVQGAPLHQHTGVLNWGTDCLHLVSTEINSLSTNYTLQDIQIDAMGLSHQYS